MKSPSIIVTIDYEMPGNGSGDIMETIIEPTDRLLNILSSMQIKMTVFFEIEEFITFQKHSDRLSKDLGYNPAILIEEQLQKMVEAGHEIALHIHPEWIGAIYENSSFSLFPHNQCLQDVFKKESDMILYFKDRAERLKKLVRQFNSEFDITSFRAGGHVIRPEKDVLQAMRSVGIKTDSSVVAGLYRVKNGHSLDFTDAHHNKGFWHVSDNVCTIAQRGDILEFPVYSQMKPEYMKLTLNRIKSKFFSSGNYLSGAARGANRLTSSKTPWGMVKNLIKKNPMKFDYCHMTTSEMLAFVKDAENDKTGKSTYPLTIIGHSKEFFNDKALISFLDTILQKNNITFKTMGQVVQEIEKKDRLNSFATKNKKMESEQLYRCIN